MSEKNKISAVDRRRKKVAIRGKHYWDKCTTYIITQNRVELRI